VGRTAVPHVLARCRSMRPISHGIVNADPAAIRILRYQYKIQETWNVLKTKAHTTPFNSVMHFVASSAVLIRIN